MPEPSQPRSSKSVSRGARAYDAAHRAERRAYAKRYREKNRRMLTAKRREYVKKNLQEIRAKQRKYREQHLEARRAAARDYARARPRRATNYQRWYRHGLSVADYRALLKKQHHCCAVCGKKPRKLVVDHNHTTDKIRGLLCLHCNSLLGFARDNKLILKAAIRYLSQSA